jgi:hypothetical protein
VDLHGNIYVRKVMNSRGKRNGEGRNRTVDAGIFRNSSLIFANPLFRSSRDLLWIADVT